MLRVNVLRIFLPASLLCLGAWESSPPAHKGGEAGAESQAQRRAGTKMAKKKDGKEE